MILSKRSARLEDEEGPFLLRLEDLEGLRLISRSDHRIEDVAFDRLRRREVDGAVQAHNAAVRRNRVGGVSRLVRLYESRRKGDSGWVRVLDHDRRGSLEFRRDSEGRIEVDQVVVGELLPLQLVRSRRRGGRERLPVERRLLIRVLPVAEVPNLVIRDPKCRREDVPLTPGKEIEDRGIVSGRVPERLEREFVPELLGYRLLLPQRA